jgi:hypothetical protein
MWARRLFSHLGVRTNAGYVSKIYVTCLWDPKESAENLNIAIYFRQKHFSQSVPRGTFVCIVVCAVDSFKTKWISDLFCATCRNHHPGPREQKRTQRSELGQSIFHSHPKAGVVFFDIVGLRDESGIHFEIGIMQIELQYEALRQCQFRK